MLIGIMGRRKSGKTLTARTITEINTSFQICSFAYALKKMFSEEFEVPYAALVDVIAKEKFRQQLIDYATLKKKENPSIFIDFLMNKISDNENIVIDDVRYIEELSSIKKRGGTPIKITVENAVRAKRGWSYDSLIDNDFSESELGDLSAHTLDKLGGYHIYNNKTIDDLYLQVQLILLKISS